MNNVASSASAFFEKYSFFINLALLVVGVVGLVLFIVASISPSSNGVFAVSEEEINSMIVDDDPKYADIEGQVVNPGVYEIYRGESVMDLVEKSGGFSEEANLEYIHKCLNLSEKLIDQQKIYVPAIGESVACGLSGVSISEGGSVNTIGLVSLNNATATELESLSGIGPSTAQKIIEARPYSEVDDILEVSGIGPATLEKIKDKITL